jgi:tetratricopeptide (TPR) repeat protein
MERRQRGLDMTGARRCRAGLTVREPGARCAVTAHTRELHTCAGPLAPLVSVPCQSGRGADEGAWLVWGLPIAQDHHAPLPLARDLPDHRWLPRPMCSLRQRAERLEPAPVLPVPRAVILAVRPAPPRRWAGAPDATSGRAAPRRERVPSAVHPLIPRLLLGNVAVPGVIGAPCREARLLRAPWLGVASPQAGVLVLRGRRCTWGRRLRDGERQRTTGRPLHHGAGRHLQPPCRTTRAAVDEGTHPARLVPARRHAGGSLRRDPCGLRVERRGDDALVHVRPVERASQRSGHRACRVVTVTAQLATVDAAPQRQDGAAHEDKARALRLTPRRHLLEAIVDIGQGHAPGKVWSPPMQPAYGHFCEPLALKKCPKYCRKDWGEDPSDIDGYALRGRIRLARGQTGEAIADFQRVLKQEPLLAEVRLNLAMANLQAGNGHQAKQELAEILKNSPQYTPASLRLAEITLQSGALQPAIDLLEPVVAREPRNTQALLLMGAAYLAAKQADKAMEIFRKTVAAAPEDPRALYWLGVGLVAQNQIEEARKTLEAALALKPDYGEPLDVLMQLADTQQNPQAAVERVEQQLDLIPTSGPLQYLLGLTYVRVAQDDKAEGALVKAIELEPKLPAPYLTLANLYARTKRLPTSMPGRNAMRKLWGSWNKLSSSTQRISKPICCVERFTNSRTPYLRRWQRMRRFWN